jgi:hypothetical protein
LRQGSDEVELCFVRHDSELCIPVDGKPLGQLPKVLAAGLVDVRATQHAPALDVCWAERAPAAQCTPPARTTAARARRTVSSTAYRRTSVVWNLYPTRRTCRARAGGMGQTHTTRLVVGWMTSYTKSRVPCCGIEECGDFGESVNSLVLAARTQGTALKPPPPTAPSARSCLSPEVLLDAASGGTYPGFNLSPVRNSRRFAKSCAGGV